MQFLWTVGLSHPLSIVQEGVGRDLPLTGASHTPAENCLGGPVDPVQVGTLVGGRGSDVRSLFCLSCISHHCLGTVPGAGVQTSPSLPATLTREPIHSQALPPLGIALRSRHYLYVPFSLPPRRNGNSAGNTT